jgi:hypothetical protein
MKTLLAITVTIAFSASADTGTVAAKPQQAPAPSTGLIDEWLREQCPAATVWDVGGQFRVRYEVKENAGSFPNNDFLRGRSRNANLLANPACSWP